MEKKKPNEKESEKDVKNVEVEKRDINRWLDNFSIAELPSVSEAPLPTIKEEKPRADISAQVQTQAEGIEEIVTNTQTSGEDKKKKTEQKYQSASYTNVANAYANEPASETIARIDDLRRVGMFVDRQMMDFSPAERPRVRAFELPEFRRQENPEEPKYAVEALDNSPRRIPEFGGTEKRVDLRKYAKKQVQ